jgi:hypothetical protein
MVSVTIDGGTIQFYQADIDKLTALRNQMQGESHAAAGAAQDPSGKSIRYRTR